MPDPFPGLCLDLEQPGLLYDAAELGTGFVALAWRNAAGEWPPPGEQADEPGPLVWLRTTASVPADTFVRLAVAAGLPVSAAVDSPTFLAIKPKSLLDHQYVTALPAAGAAEVPRLLALLEAGAQILFYGPVSGADPELLARLGLAVGAPLDGPGLLSGDGLESRPLLHDQAAAGGPLAAEVVGPETVLRASVAVGREVRAYAVRCGSAAWVHGSGPQPDRSPLAGQLALALLADLGLVVQHAGGPLLWWRRDNALRLVAASSGVVGLGLPDGAPLPTGRGIELDEGVARCRLVGHEVAEVRAFVRQYHGEVSCEAFSPAGRSGGLRLEGLDDAVAVIRPPYDLVESAKVDGSGAVFADERLGVVVVFGVSGELQVSW